MKYATLAGSLGASYLSLLQVPGEAAAETWSAGDMRAILDHQFNVPLERELPAAALPCRCTVPGGANLERCHSFGQLLRCASPSRDLLNHVKSFAKQAGRAEGDLPREVARYFYVVSILRARMFGIKGVSALSDSATDREAGRCLTYGWLSDDARALLRESLVGARVTGDPGAAGGGGL